MLKVYIIGVAILIIAIVANAIIVKLGINSWYDFINLLVEHGTKAFNKLSLLDYIWLFIGYPFILGLGYVLGDKVHALLFS